MRASSLFESILCAALFILVIGHAVMLVGWIISVLQQTGGFPSSYEQLQEMGARIDKSELAQREKRYKRAMLRLWIACAALAGVGLVGRLVVK